MQVTRRVKIQEEVDVVVNISVDDFLLSLSENLADQQQALWGGLHLFATFLSAIPETYIASLGTNDRLMIHRFLLEQAQRYTNKADERLLPA